MTFELPPIVKSAEQLRLEIERAVRRWTRDNRACHGVELRQQAKEVVKAAHLAWRAREHQAQRIEELSQQVDALKLDLQLAQQLPAFASLAQFETIYRIAREVGQQVGGWKKEQHSKRQNATPEKQAPSQRAQILSTRDASREARR